MFRTLLIACFLLVSAIAIAADDPRPVPPPTHQPYQCDLPTQDQPIDLKYKIWYVDSGSNPAGKNAFCDEVVNSQDEFHGSKFYVNFYDEPDASDRSDDDQIAEFDACSHLETKDVDDARYIRKIHAFVKKLDSSKLTRSDIDRFIRDAKDHYYDKYFINIYVVTLDVIEARGIHLRDQRRVNQTPYQAQSNRDKYVTEGNLIFVPYEVSLGTLTHEMGHALSLDHVNFWDKPLRGDSNVSDDDKKQNEYCVKYDYWDNRCHFQLNNFLWAGASIARTTFTEGQKERMACNSWSALNIKAPSNSSGGDQVSANNTFRCPDWSIADLSTIKEFGGTGPVKKCPPLDYMKGESDNGR